MYKEFYHLKESPFTILPDPGYLFMSSKHKTAIDYLHYGFMQQAGFIVISGEIGTGKTTLIKYLVKEIEDNINLAIIFNTNFNSEQFLQAVLKEFEIGYKDKDKIALYEALNKFIIEQYVKKRKTVLIIDEAQNLSPSVLEEVRMISNLQTEKEHLIRIVLVGQPGLREVLLKPGLEQFAQRIAVNYHLDRLSSPEVKEYIHHRLSVAGANTNEIFSDRAINKIAIYSEGIPRVINIICDMALVYGFADSLPQISDKVIENVVADKKEGGLFLAEKSGPPSVSQNKNNWKIELRLLEGKIADLEQSIKILENKKKSRDKSVTKKYKSNIIEEFKQTLITTEKTLKIHDMELKKLRSEKNNLIKCLSNFEHDLERIKRHSKIILNVALIVAFIAVSALIICSFIKY